MKIALYFILFVGFMATVTIIDRLTSGPLIDLEKGEKRDGAIVFSSSKIDEDSNVSRKNQLTKDTEIVRRKYEKGDGESGRKITKSTKVGVQKITGSSSSSDSPLGRSITRKKRNERSKGEVIYKGADYSVFTFSRGKMIPEKKIWFDYMNPPSKKLRKDQYNNIWSKKGCCFWRNGDNYEVVFESNLYFEIGAKKIPVKK